MTGRRDVTVYRWWHATAVLSYNDGWRGDRSVVWHVRGLSLPPTASSTDLARNKDKDRLCTHQPKVHICHVKMRTQGAFAVYSQVVMCCTRTPRRVGWCSAGRKWKSSDRCAPQTWRPRRRSAPPETHRWAPLSSVRHPYTLDGKEEVFFYKQIARSWLWPRRRVRGLTPQTGHRRCSSWDPDSWWRSICRAARWTFGVQEVLFKCIQLPAQSANKI